MRSAPPDFDDLWDFSDPEATRERFEALLDEHSEHAPLPWRLELATQIARTHSLVRKLDEAHELLDEVERQLSEASAGDGHVEGAMVVPRLRYLLERGRTLNSGGRVDEARPLFVAAWERGREAGADARAVDAAHMVAICDHNEGAADEALTWNHRALELAESSDDPAAQRWQGSLYNNIGWTLHDAERYDEALAVFERALAFRRRQADESDVDPDSHNTTRIARWCVARCWRSLGRLEEALAEQRSLAATAGDEGPGGYTEEELGECLLALGRAAEARPHFARAHAILSKDDWLVDEEPERIARLAKLGGVKRD